MNRSRASRWLGVLLLVAGVTGASGVENRFSDVFYLDEAGLKPIPLKTLRAVALTFSRDQSTILAPLAAGRGVWLIGYAERRYYVSSVITTGAVRGWVDADALQPLTLEQRAELDNKREVFQAQKAAIARHEVLLGMMQAQVTAALGNPTERTRSTTAQGDEEVWSYITYRSEPYTQTYVVAGQYVTETRYRKVPTGGKHISFRNGLVVGIREGKDPAQPEPPPTVVTTVPVIIVPPGSHPPITHPVKPPALKPGPQPKTLPVIKKGGSQDKNP
ncbi:MAG: hypothetical protein HZA91_09845 [Verrucomicrobia bacterium]|nr:hypothetical protein [Verrucomicrobiota bacterium]